jgi:hypothetical protein
MSICALAVIEVSHEKKVHVTASSDVENPNRVHFDVRFRSLSALRTACFAPARTSAGTLRSGSAQMVVGRVLAFEKPTRHPALSHLRRQDTKSLLLMTGPVRGASWAPQDGQGRGFSISRVFRARHRVVKTSTETCPCLPFVTILSRPIASIQGQEWCP